jgi:hypothetical protein
MKALYKIMIASAAMVIAGAVGMRAQDPARSTQGPDKTQKADSSRKSMKAVRDSTMTPDKKTKGETDHSRTKGDKMHQDGMNKTSPADSSRN